MNNYMRALHQRFYQEPDFRELEEDIENTRQEVRDCLDKLQRRRLMHLVDSQNLLREEISLASFTVGFKLAWGLSKELEADGLYSFRRGGDRPDLPQNGTGGVIEMTNRLPIQRCQYCGCEDIGLGWQHGEALVTFKKHGMLGNRLRYLICRRCGAVLYQYVAEPYKYPPVK